MNNGQLYIPKKIMVGYNKRDDTYTKKLAYVIYYDDKGVLRKEASWQNWRDKKIESDEFDNVPTEGFVLNKGVGGQRESYGWNARNEYIRVYDPRGFEFEISVENLLYILQEATSTKGKGLEGEFIYSWDKKDLVLIPVDSGAYKESQVFTSLQSKAVSTKDLVPGCAYRTKKQLDLIYLGRFPWYTMVNCGEANYINGRLNRDYDHYHKRLKESKMHIFLNEKGKKDDDKYVVVATPTNISVCINDVPVSNYAELIEDYNKEKINASKPIGLELVRKTIKVNESSQNWWDAIDETQYAFDLSDNSYALETIQVDYDYRGGKYQINGLKKYPRGVVVSFKDGKLETKGNNKGASSYYTNTRSVEEINQNGVYVLYVKLENGKKIKFSKYGI